MIVDFEKLQPLHLKTALQYAAIGWHVFPCWPVVERDNVRACGCGNTDCKSPGKHPISKLAPKGQNDATTDAAKIESWWRAMPGANIGI